MQEEEYIRIVSFSPWHGKANFQETYLNYILPSQNVGELDQALLDKGGEECLAILMIKYTKNS